MATGSVSKRALIRWTTLKGLTALLLFILVAALAEYTVVLYAINLGVKDQSVLQWGFSFLGSDYSSALSVSPLFHLVPLTVVAVLVSVWVYLTRHLAVKPTDIRQQRPSVTAKRGADQKKAEKKNAQLSIGKRLALVGKRIRLTKATVRSALVVFTIFLLLAFAFSLLVYPRMIYQTIASAYENNPALLNFIKGTGEALASAGSFLSAINDAVVGASPGFHDFVQGLGGTIGWLADLDNAGKYLLFQNTAAWICAMIALLYGQFGRKSYQHKKK